MTFILILFSSAFVLNTLCTVDVIKPKEVKFDVWFVLFMTWFKILFPSPRSNGHSLIFSPNYVKIPGFLFCFCLVIVVVVSSILLLLLGFPLFSSMSSQLPFAHLSAHVSSLPCPPIRETTYPWHQLFFQIILLFPSQQLLISAKIQFYSFPHLVFFFFLLSHA